MQKAERLSSSVPGGWVAGAHMEDPMPWSVSYSSELDAVITVYSGRLLPDALREAVEATLRTGRQHGTTRFLADCAGLEGGHSVSDLYYLTQTLETSGLEHGAREAVLLPQLTGAVEDVRFWETVCLNRGYMVRVFRTRSEATDWLTERRVPGEG